MNFTDVGGIRQQEAAFALAAKVCKLWRDEVTLLLWRLCVKPDFVRRHVCASRQALVASHMRRVSLFSGGRLWAGSSLYMPSFPNIKDIRTLCTASDFSSQVIYLLKLLNSRIESLSFETMPHYDPAIDQADPCIATHLPWLRAVEHRCANLNSLELDMRLPPSAITNLSRLLLSSSLKKLYLGPLLDDVLDDFTVALALAQQSIEDLTIAYPITLEALAILDQQCCGRPILARLQYLQITSTINAGEVLSLLLSMTPNLTLFYLTLYLSETDKPWTMQSQGFEALAQLQHLAALAINFECATDPNVAIKGADLMAIARIPHLKSLRLETHLPHFKNMLLIREINAVEVIYLMRRWQRLSPDSKLNLWIDKLSCTEAQEQIQRELFDAIKTLNFSVRTLVIEEDVAPNSSRTDPEVWLGSNANFAPDPQKWCPRQLYHPGAELGRMDTNNEHDDEYLVWGHEDVQHKRYDE